MTYRNRDDEDLLAEATELKETLEPEPAMAALHPDTCADQHAWIDRVPDFCAAHGLSRRECDVLAGIICREKNTVMARRLGISVDTVRFHLKSIYRKLDAADRVDLVILFFDFCWRGAQEDKSTRKGS